MINLSKRFYLCPGTPLRIKGAQGQEYFEVFYPDLTRRLLDGNGKDWTDVAHEEDFYELAESERAELQEIGRLIREREIELSLDV